MYGRLKRIDKHRLKPSQVKTRPPGKSSAANKRWSDGNVQQAYCSNEVNEEVRMEFSRTELVRVTSRLLSTPCKATIRCDIA